MERSYMLNTYVNENEENFVNMENADTYLENLEFRIKGSKSINEIKKQVEIFLFKNDVPLEIKDGLKDICDKFNETTTLYQAEIQLEEFVEKYFNEQKKEYDESNNTVVEIKEELVNGVKKNLENVGIELTGDIDYVTENINSESDVLKLKENVATVTDYYSNLNEIKTIDDKQTLEVDVNNLNETLENAGDETLLENIVQEEQIALEVSNPTDVVGDELVESNENIVVEDVVTEEQIDVNDSISVEVADDNSMFMSNQNQINSLKICTYINDDGSIVYTSDSFNLDSMNYVCMLTNDLIVNNALGVDKKIDMKFIKNDGNDINSFKVIFNDFSLKNNTLNLDEKNIIQYILNGYNQNINYSELLQQKSPELAASFKIISNYILNEKGSFQMAIKNNGNSKDIILAMDNNYNNVFESFQQSGAVTTNDLNENNIVRISDANTLEQMLVLNTTIESLEQQKVQENQNKLAFQNQYQKKLIYDNQLNNVANVNNSFLIVVTIANILLLLLMFYFILI